jgi:hypothetical protein
MYKRKIGCIWFRLGSVERRGFLDWLADYQFLKNDSAQCKKLEQCLHKAHPGVAEALARWSAVFCKLFCPSLSYLWPTNKKPYVHRERPGRCGHCIVLSCPFRSNDDDWVKDGCVAAVKTRAIISDTARKKHPASYSWQLLRLCFITVFTKTTTGPYPEPE